jgi:outer membrane protein OmpA-like peptidoglycan-associated protein
VDIHGCPIDSDFDGVPDYLDACPFNEVGAWVDENGCPTDADGDGVPDGLDDCPYTLTGVDVDKYGCIDLSMFSKPMVLNIDYLPGSFEIDPHTKERLKKLAGVLNFLPDIKIEIHGYTDNIGTEVANRNLSEKRAARVRDYLVSLGVAKDRMKVFGRGEANFVASNDTAEGRAKNRRIELIFYR